MPRTAIAALVLSTLFLLSGCKKHVACDPADSRAVCEQFQQCLRSDTSAEVCRMAEEDANRLDNNAKY
jgi:uncharacterized protein YgiB involved in biofilm formation